MTDDFGRWLKQKIAEQPSTITEFARRIGVKSPVVHFWCSGGRSIRADFITRIASALGLAREEVQERHDRSRSKLVKAA